MPRPPRFQKPGFDKRDSGSRRPANKKQFRRGDTPRDWTGRGPQEGRQEAAGPEERLQKVLAAMGVGSRRDCEVLITDGRVEVDKQVVTKLGTKVDPFKQEIRVDGETLKRPERMYFAVNKPEGVVTTNFDPSGRERVIDLVPTDARLFAVGRLDRSSEGLILLTNDGEFANRLTHPRYGVEKTYLVRVAGEPGEEKLNKLRRGIHLSDGVCRVQRIVIKGRHKQSTDMIMVLNEGRNREIRRILARVGHKVLKLRRVGIGQLKLGDLPLAAWRKLTQGEVDGLMHETRKRPAARSRGPEFGDRGQGEGFRGGEMAAGRAAGAIRTAEPAAEKALPRHSVMPELGGGDDDGDLAVDDFAATTDEEMVEISGFSEDDAAVVPGDVLDYEEDAGDESVEDDEELGLEDVLGDEDPDDSEEALRAPVQERQRPARPDRSGPGSRSESKPGKKFSKRPFENRGSGGPPAGKRPFKKKFERGGPRPAGGRSAAEGSGEKPARKFGRRGGKVKFAPKPVGKPGAKPAARPAGKPGRKFTPRPEGASSGGGGHGAKFGGGPGKKFRGKPGGKFGGKKGFKPKGKGRP
ncbi:MAG: pseudouridine synthase [Pirellulaceae bacterium]|nr:pseudouridine synthase [Pirellulaceae bacterium]